MRFVLAGFVATMALLAQAPEGGVMTQGLAVETFSCGNLTAQCSGPARRFIEAKCGIVVT
jgi:hypothetical protein